MTDFNFQINPNNELYLNGSYALTEAGFNQLVNVFSDDVPTEFFPNGLPGPGDDGPDATLRFSDYDMSPINEYSNIELEQIRVTLGWRLKIMKSMGIFAAVSYWDVEDNQPYIENYSGEVKLVQGGFNWTF